MVTLGTRMLADYAKMSIDEWLWRRTEINLSFAAHHDASFQLTGWEGNIRSRPFEVSQRRKKEIDFMRRKVC
jgi:hypothetical protein